MTKRKKVIIVLSWFFVFLLMAVIFYLSAQTANESAALSGGVIDTIFNLLHIQPSSFLIRKLAHASEYFLLAILFSNAFFQTKGKPISSVSFALSVLYACTDEFHQHFVEGRACTLFDVGVDASGALFGTLLCFIIYIIYTRRKNREETK